MIPKLTLPSPKKIANKVKDVVSPRDTYGHRRNLVKESVRGVRSFGRTLFRAPVPEIHHTTENTTAETLKSIRKEFQKAYSSFEIELDRTGVVQSSKDYLHSDLYKMNQRSPDVGVKPKNDQDAALLEKYWAAAEFTQMDNQYVLEFFAASFRALRWSGTDLLPTDKAGAEVMLKNALTVLDNMEAAYEKLASQRYNEGSSHFDPDKSMAEPLDKMRGKCHQYLNRLDQLDKLNQRDESVELESESSAAF